MNSIDIINYRPGWQRLRVSTLAVNNPYGGMTTPDGAMDAIARMQNYIADTVVDSGAVPGYVIDEVERMRNTVEEEHAARVYRVYRFLTATINGLRQWAVVDESNIRKIRETALLLQPQINLKLAQKAADYWNWNVVRYELETMWRQERYWFTAIEADMKERVQEKGKSAKNMLDFIGIIEEVNHLGN